MKERICILLSTIHLLCLAISTYIAAIDVGSIIVTGWICSATAIATGIAAIFCNRPVLMFASFVTPLIGIVLVVLESAYLHLGPQRAAFPFCIVFIINQAITTVVILIELKLFLSPPTARRWQVSMQMLMVTMASFCIFFAGARIAVRYEHNWIMSTALGLLGLTFVGLSLVLYTQLKGQKTVAATDDEVAAADHSSPSE